MMVIKYTFQIRGKKRVIGLFIFIYRKKFLDTLQQFSRKNVMPNNGDKLHLR